VSQADSAGRLTGRRIGSKGIGMKREIAARLGLKNEDLTPVLAGRRIGSKGIGMKRPIAARLGFKNKDLTPVLARQSGTWPRAWIGADWVPGGA